MMMMLYTLLARAKFRESSQDFLSNQTGGVHNGLFELFGGEGSHVGASARGAVRELKVKTKVRINWIQC